jgi:hypothetical protein
MAQPVTAQDVIYLTQQGVAPDVIQSMQTPRVAQVPPPAVVVPPPGPVIIEEYRPYCPPPHIHYFHHHHHRPRVGWGVTFSG